MTRYFDKEREVKNFRFGVFFSACVLLSFSSFCHADFLQDLFKKPRYYQGSQISFNATDISLGFAWADIPQTENASMSTMYVQWAKFRDDQYWKDRDLAQLGDYAIGVGVLVTLFGYEGLKPIIGFKTYNLKSAEMQLGLAYNYYNKDYDFIDSLALYYDPTVKRVVFNVFFLK
jgi:hypothetical protein